MVTLPAPNAVGCDSPTGGTRGLETVPSDPILSSVHKQPNQMKFNTHNLIDADLFYFGFDLNAYQTTGEYLGISIGSLYFGIYNLGNGLEIACGILDENGAL
jgi:hypothetical protein